MSKERLGIPSNGFEYQKLNAMQDPIKEFFVTTDFLNDVFLRQLKDVAPEMISDNMRLEFINYGDTQLVYVFSSGDKKWSVLVGQPATEMGTVKKEYDNLKLLGELFPNEIVTPLHYFSNGSRELYIAPYIYQARCIASQDHGFGIYIPEPYYRFETFDQNTKRNVNICMIANLVRMFNEVDGLGIGSCKIGGGDFILEKSWDSGGKDIENTLKKMKLIAARELVAMSFDDYQKRLLEEFSQRTYYSRYEDRDPNILINHKARVPMKIDEIEKGIQLGLKLRNYK